ncbi:phosphoglycerate kinase [Patescibacteria group bacterium]|nr:phosphoglycerate kinase [Patescibacteria group bacterium]
MKSLRDFDFKDKRVLVRCDFNVPLTPEGEILDDFRIRKTIPTIEYLIKKGAKIILMSHLDNPGGEIVERLRLNMIQEKLMEYLDLSVVKAKDCLGKEIEKWIDSMRSGEILLLENLRFHKEEKGNSENFAKELSRLGDIFINEAFSTCHRPHASIAKVPKYLPSGVGLLSEKEIKILSKVLEKPWRPLVAIIGGIKVSTKAKAIPKFLKIADHLLVGGEIANIILRIKGISIGKPWPEKEVIEEIKKLDLTNPKLHLPMDGIVSLESGEGDYIREAALGSIRKEEGVFDIGPETIKIFSQIIKNAQMIIWSGPLGVYEKKQFEKGTKEIAQAIIRNPLVFKIAGGGDTLSALNKFNLADKFDYLSTGGGAMLKFLGGEKLPGLEALNFYEKNSKFYAGIKK